MKKIKKKKTSILNCFFKFFKHLRVQLNYFSPSKNISEQNLENRRQFFKHITTAL